MKDRWCSDCAKSGHFAHSCYRNPFRHRLSDVRIIAYKDLYNINPRRATDGNNSTSVSNISSTNCSKTGDVYVTNNQTQDKLSSVSLDNVDVEMSTKNSLLEAPRGTVGNNKMPNDTAIMKCDDVTIGKNEKVAEHPKISDELILEITLHKNSSESLADIQGNVSRTLNFQVSPSNTPITELDGLKSVSKSNEPSLTLKSTNTELKSLNQSVDDSDLNCSHKSMSKTDQQFLVSKSTNVRQSSNQSNNDSAINYLNNNLPEKDPKIVNKISPTIFKSNEPNGDSNQSNNDSNKLNSDLNKSEGDASINYTCTNVPKNDEQIPIPKTVKVTSSANQSVNSSNVNCSQNTNSNEQSTNVILKPSNQSNNPSNINCSRNNVYNSFPPPDLVPEYFRRQCFMNFNAKDIPQFSKVDTVFEANKTVMGNIEKQQNNQDESGKTTNYKVKNISSKETTATASVIIEKNILNKKDNFENCVNVQKNAADEECNLKDAGSGTQIIFINKTNISHVQKNDTNDQNVVEIYPKNNEFIPFNTNTPRTLSKEPFNHVNFEIITKTIPMPLYKYAFLQSSIGDKFMWTINKSSPKLRISSRCVRGGPNSAGEILLEGKVASIKYFETRLKQFMKQRPSIKKFPKTTSALLEFLQTNLHVMETLNINCNDTIQKVNRLKAKNANSSAIYDLHKKLHVMLFGKNKIREGAQHVTNLYNWVEKLKKMNKTELLPLAYLFDIEKSYTYIFRVKRKAKDYYEKLIQTDLVKGISVINTSSVASSSSQISKNQRKQYRRQSRLIIEKCKQYYLNHELENFENIQAEIERSNFSDKSYKDYKKFHKNFYEMLSRIR